MSTGSILSILAYPQYGYHLVCHMGLNLVHCSYLSVGSLHVLLSAIHKSFEALVPLVSCDFEPHPHLHILLLQVYCGDQGVQDTLATAILRF